MRSGGKGMWGRGPALYKHNYYYYTCVLLLLYLLSDLPPLPKLNVQNIQTVCVWGGGGDCAVDHILQEFYTLCLT
jgi:hypothetical protein